MPDETDLVARIAHTLPSFKGPNGNRLGVDLGIGDDATVMRADQGKAWVVTTDAFLEDVHFWADRHPADSVGYKALARATSDLAAMGAHPRFFLLTLALPRRRTGRWLQAMLAGMRRAALELGLKLIGGDTTQASAIFMSLTVIGEIARGKSVTRSGARPGDLLYVSGPLGGAQLGLELMRAGLGGERRSRHLLETHFYPKVRIRLGAWLAKHGVCSSMMDLSDGLTSDLERLCAASRVGARVYEDQIPCVGIPAQLSAKLHGRKSDPLTMALHGGDDYELLFTVPKRRVPKLRGAPGLSGLHWIGEIQPGKGAWLVRADGRQYPLPALGWDSFREK